MYDNVLMKQYIVVSTKNSQHPKLELIHGSAPRYWPSATALPAVTGGSRGTAFHYPKEVHQRLSFSVQGYLEHTLKQYIF
jgi:hypothetical protein